MLLRHYVIMIFLWYFCVLFWSSKASSPWGLIAWKRAAKISSFRHFKHGRHIACSLHRLQLVTLKCLVSPGKTLMCCWGMLSKHGQWQKLHPLLRHSRSWPPLPWHMIRESAAKGIPVCVCLFFNVRWNVSGWQTVTSQCQSVLRNVVGSSSSGVCSAMGDYAEYFRLMRRNAVCMACCADRRPSPISSKDNMTQNALISVTWVRHTVQLEIMYGGTMLLLDCYWMVMILLVRALLLLLLIFVVMVLTS